MLKLILCDDAPFILRLGAEKIDELTASRKWDVKVVGLALDSNEIISFVKKNPSRYLIFLDLDFWKKQRHGKAFRRIPQVYINAFKQNGRVGIRAVP